jgi:hypothetical protein
MNAEKTVIVLSWFVMATLALAIARQLSEQYELNIFPSRYGAPSYNRQGWNKSLWEGFESSYDGVKGVDDKTEVSSGNPADASLSNMRAPYSLLTGVLPVKPENQVTDLTAKGCYEKDFMSKTDKTGNYIQRTNNYKHDEPDNCSMPLTEMVGAFYGSRV